MSFCLSVYLTVCVSVCLSVFCLSIYLFVCLSICLSMPVCLPVFVCLSVCLCVSVCLSVYACVSFCLFCLPDYSVRVSVCLPVYLCVSLSLSFLPCVILSIRLSIGPPASLSGCLHIPLYLSTWLTDRWTDWPIVFLSTYLSTIHDHSLYHLLSYQYFRFGIDTKQLPDPATRWSDFMFALSLLNDREGYIWNPDTW